MRVTALDSGAGGQRSTGDTDALIALYTDDAVLGSGGPKRKDR